MTGQGVATTAADGTTVTVEIRAVNNRHLKINLRSPDSTIAYESIIEKRIRAAVVRGTVNVNIKVEKASREDDFSIDTALLESYRADLESHTGSPVALEKLLHLPGIVRNTSNMGPKGVGLELIEHAVTEALSNFNPFK